MSDADDRRARALRAHIQTFVQLFGLHQQHRTPCGEPLTVPYAHALMRLLDADRADAAGLRISELGEHLNVDKSNVSRLCGRMEEQGHLERRPCPDDGRVKRLWLTDAGRELARRVDEASLGRFSRLLDAMDDGEHARLLDSLQTLNDALRDTFHEDQQT